MDNIGIFWVGSFGRVLLAKNKKNGEYFAMKRLKKADIIKLRQVDHVISENTILADIDHPFLVRRLIADCSGGTERIFARREISLLFDAVHPRRRAFHVLAHRGKTFSRPRDVRDSFNNLAGFTLRK